MSEYEIDVLIVGAGISGISAAAHLRTLRPGTSFLMLDGRDSIGGTWDLFRYPGIRSDSDMPTFGFGFKQWTGTQVIADGPTILDYLRETIAEHHLDQHLRLGHRVLSADFTRASGRWRVLVQTADGEVSYSARFLYLGTGYYDYDGGYTPDFPGAEDFAGQIVHPQQWPERLELSGKQLVVIGSGATAVSLIPALIDEAAHVTMLQRSPSYVISRPGREPPPRRLARVMGERRARSLVRARNIALHRTIFVACRRVPALMRRVLLRQVARQLPPGYDVATHFTPRYNPWQERLCLVPDGDLFAAISSGRASVVTEKIERFTPSGVLLESGRELPADIIVTATGLRLQPFGRIRLSVDGEEVSPSETVFFKAMMLSGVPNLVVAFGYTNLSWTLKIDLISEHFCRLLGYLDEHGYDVAEPVLDDPAMARAPLFDLQAGYIRRGIEQFPHAGTRGPWTTPMAYEQDLRRLRHGPVADPALRLTRVRSAAPAAT